MIIILGLVILLAAVIAGVAGVLGNGGTGHALTHPFAVFGYHVTGSTGTLFLYGIVVGAVALLGLSLLLAAYARSGLIGGIGAMRGSAYVNRVRRSPCHVPRTRGHQVNARRQRDRTTPSIDLIAPTNFGICQEICGELPGSQRHMRGAWKLQRF